MPLTKGDQHDTVFITNNGVHCYRVMPFGLKNAGVIYPRMVNKVFNAQIGRNLEVYMDNMITKSKEAREYTADLNNENIWPYLG